MQEIRQKPIRTLGLWLVLVLAFVITGCGSDPVSTVKDGRMQFDQSTTLGKALSAYKYYQSVEWETFETDNGKTMVQATATVDMDPKKLADYVTEDHDLSAIEGWQIFIEWQWAILPKDDFEITYAGWVIETAEGERTEGAVNWMSELEAVYNNSESTALSSILLTRVPMDGFAF